jgi:hypothetical protein
MVGFVSLLLGENGIEPLVMELLLAEHASCEKQREHLFLLSPNNRVVHLFV